MAKHFIITDNCHVPGDEKGFNDYLYLTGIQ